MSFVGRFVAIYRTDLKLLRRDPMLLYSVAMVFLLLFVLRYFEERLGILYPIAALLVLVLIPMIFGMLPGFMIADEKEDKTIQALQVIPISSQAFLVHRLTWASLATVILTGVSPYVVGVEIPQEGLLALMALFVLEAWIYALMITVLSESRMQALTVAKVMGWLLLLPLAVKFIVLWRHLSTDWSRFTSFLPTHWAYKLFEGIPSNDLSNFPVALAVHLAWLLSLVVLFSRRVL